METNIFSWLRKFVNLGMSKQLKGSIERINALQVHKFSSKDTPMLSPGNSLLDALEVFVKNYIRAVVVVDKNKVLGIVTKIDLLAALRSCEYKRLEATRITEIMREKYVSLSPENTFSQGFHALMKSEEEVCVVEKSRSVIGVIDFSDILDVFRNSNFVIQSPPKLTSAIIKRINKIDHDENLDRLIALFIEGKVEYAIVLKNEEMAGIITVKDVISALYKNMSCNSTRAREIMSPRVRTMHPGTSVYDVLDFSREQEFNQIPIMIEGELVGIVTLKSLAKFYCDFLAQVQSTA